MRQIYQRAFSINGPDHKRKFKQNQKKKRKNTIQFDYYQNLIRGRTDRNLILHSRITHQTRTTQQYEYNRFQSARDKYYDYWLGLYALNFYYFRIRNRETPPPPKIITIINNSNNCSTQQYWMSILFCVWFVCCCCCCSVLQWILNKHT